MTKQIHDLPVNQSVHEKTMQQLLDHLAEFQFQAGIDPAVAHAFEHVAEAIRRIFNDINS